MHDSLWKLSDSQVGVYKTQFTAQFQSLFFHLFGYILKKCLYAFIIFWRLICFFNDVTLKWLTDIDKSADDGCEQLKGSVGRVWERSMGNQGSIPGGAMSFIQWTLLPNYEATWRLKSWSPCAGPHSRSNIRFIQHKNTTAIIGWTVPPWPKSTQQVSLFQQLPEVHSHITTDMAQAEKACSSVYKGKRCLKESSQWSTVWSDLHYRYRTKL